jgi:FMN-dependent NADH-azoreductase
VKDWKAANPGGTVVTRDLTTTEMKPVTGEWIFASFTPEDKRTGEQKAALAQSDTLIGEILSADELVFGVPMYNFGVPAALKLWIDLIVRANVTFAYVDGQPQGLVKGKKANFFIASGGNYAPGTPTEGYNFVQPYLTAIFGFLGITEQYFQTAGGTIALNYGADRAEFLAPQLETIKSKFAK